MNLTQGYKGADKGIQDSLRSAENKFEGWGDLAFAFMVNWIQKRKHNILELRFADRAYTDAPIEFAAFEATDAYLESDYVQPPSLKAFGAVYRRLQREGYIEKTGKTKPSPRRHATDSPVWRIL